VAGYQLDGSVVVLALGISLAAAIIGTMAAVQRAVRLPPAEAMRPEPPATFRRTLVERLGLGAILPQAARMILRQMERHPVKSAISCLGIATGVAVMVLGSFMKDSLTYIMDFQFRLAQRQHLMITFVEPTSPQVLHDVKHLPGVLQCEPFRSVPSRLTVGHRSRRVGIMGLPSENSLFRLIDENERVVRIPDEGLLLSSKLAELLDAGVGDTITVEILEGERAERRIPVGALITEFSGTNAYMNLRALTRMLHEGPNLGGAFLTFDPLHAESLYHALKETPQIAGVSIKSAALKSFEDTLAENLLRMRTFNIIFASIIACGVVYNSARISLAERSRELATLRVIGFTRQEISAILLGELAILTLLAIPLGMVMGYGFAAFAALGLDTELYRIPLVVESSTFGFAGVVIVVAAMVSGLLVRRRLDHLDLVQVLMVQVLKSKE
jgi:putative ABC transport system permease protein